MSGRVTALCFVIALTSCAAPPPPPPPTVVKISLAAASDANPGPDGQGAPVTLRVYQLASSAGFGNAEFFPLYNADAATLGADLLKRDDVVLAPGQTRDLTLMPRDDVKFLGVFAGLRDYQGAQWRGAVDVAPHQTTLVTVTASRNGVSLVAKPLPAPKQAGS